MKIERIFTHSPLRNFSYLIYAEDGSRVICIDPWDSQQISNYLEERNLRLTHIINTHEHHDHIRGNEGLVERYHAQVLAHEKASRFIPQMEYALHAGDRIDIVDDCYMETMDTPGHTFSHLSLLLYKKKESYAVFSGDTFFNAGVGNCKSGGNPNTLYESISGQYAVLPDHVYVYPGHDYMENNIGFTLAYEQTNLDAKAIAGKSKNQDRYRISTMGLERKINLFLRLDSHPLRRSLQKHCPEIHANSSSRDVFLHLRRLRDQW